MSPSFDPRPVGERSTDVVRIKALFWARSRETSLSAGTIAGGSPSPRVSATEALNASLLVQSPNETAPSSSTSRGSHPSPLDPGQQARWTTYLGREHCLSLATCTKLTRPELISCSKNGRPSTDQC